ncbi:MAG: glutamate--tRNA ligase [Thermoplasmata archaeon]|nr:glutamate--tRNA ligase [Thermoplasmata archaeon]
MSIESLARKYALQNAIEYDGKANPGSVIGKIMNEGTEFRSQAKQVAEISRQVIVEVNAMSPEEQKAELEQLAPELLVKKKKEIIKELPALENGEKGVVMRLAPNPSGPLHIGHTRMAILNDEYVKKYGGKLIVRMEDTNPPTILPEAYDLILEDLDWLGIEYHEVINQSDRFGIYYEYAEKILVLGKGYMCDCESESWRKLKDEKKPCPHRDTAPDINVKLWEDMLAGKFELGQISMVVKTDIQHKNPAVRDFVAMRMVEEPHPLTGSKYLVYPLYNFSVAIDDYDMGMTHVLRGKDHLNNTIRQEYVYEHLGWDKPVFIHYGWVSIDDTVLSTRQIKAAIQEGKYSGWDDHQLGTVAALARRGIHPDAIRQFWNDVGAKSVDIKFSWENLHAMNKDIIDKDAIRLFFVWKPKEIKITGIDKLQSRAPLHPERSELGVRVTELSGNITVQITYDDYENLKPGNLVRLKDLCNLEMMSDGSFKYIGNDLDVLKKGAKIIHWVGPKALDAEVQMPDGTTISGLVEKAAENYADRVVQFERFGFVRLEPDENIIAFFAHK